MRSYSFNSLLRDQSSKSFAVVPKKTKTFQFSLARSERNFELIRKWHEQLSILSCEISRRKIGRRSSWLRISFNSLLRDQLWVFRPVFRRVLKLSILSCEIRWVEALPVHHSCWSFQFSLARSVDRVVAPPPHRAKPFNSLLRDQGCLSALIDLSRPAFNSLLRDQIYPVVVYYRKKGSFQFSLARSGSPWQWWLLACGSFNSLLRDQSLSRRWSSGTYMPFNSLLRDQFPVVSFLWLGT